MTDLPPQEWSVPSRLGVSLEVRDDGLVGCLDPLPAVCDRGVVPVSALVFLADVVAGLAVDTDPDTWTFTSDVTIRAPLDAAPGRIEACSITRRSGARSITCEVPFAVDGRSWGSCFIGFARVPRRPGDPPKPVFELDAAVEHWDQVPPLETSLREAMALETRDPATGSLAVGLRPELLNPAGALQGAMVAYLCEAAAEDLADRRLGVADPPRRHVVTEMDVRFLAQNRTPPIVSSATFVGPPTEGIVRVDLHDGDGTGRHTTAVLARVRRVDA